MLQLLFLLVERMSVIVTIAFVFTRLKAFRRVIEQGASRKGKAYVALIGGAFGMIGTYSGIAVTPGTGSANLWIDQLRLEEAIANSRVVGVAIAGLIGGPWVGLGAGLIAGGHRLALGGFTAFACFLSTFVEGALAGFVKGVREKRGKPISPLVALVTGMTGEALQMGIILLVARPFEQAWGLVQLIALPMIVANGIGIAIFMTIIHTILQEEERAGAVQAQKALQIANRTLVHLRRGLTESSAAEVARILVRHTEIDAAEITDREKTLAYYGVGREHHRVGEPIWTEATRRVLAREELYIARSPEEILCRYEDCPLQSAIVVPLRQREKTIGTLKMYYASPKKVTTIDSELAQGLAQLFSQQLDLAEAERLARMANEAEIRALQAQIQPHFLFNSLNLIMSLIRTRPETARKLLVQLGHYFRQNLKSSMHPLVPLKQEWEHVRAYLAIEEERFFGRLEVRYRFDNRAGEAMLPPLTLQPLVENAIKHGLRGMRKGSRLELSVELLEQEGRVKICVRDNGCGIPEEQKSDLLQRPVRSGKGTGIGLYNVHQRLVAMFGKDSGLRLESQPGSGTSVCFQIPFKGEKEE